MSPYGRSRDPAAADLPSAGFVDHPEEVTSTVEELTCAPARSFDEWARDHADDFR